MCCFFSYHILLNFFYQSPLYLPFSICNIHSQISVRCREDPVHLRDEWSHLRTFVSAFLFTFCLISLFSFCPPIWNVIAKDSRGGILFSFFPMNRVPFAALSLSFPSPTGHSAIFHIYFIFVSSLPFFPISFCSAHFSDCLYSFMCQSISTVWYYRCFAS